MSITPHSRLDLEALADAGQHLDGRLDAARLDARLAAALDRDEVTGDVYYTLDFKRLPNGETGMSGQLQACLQARCQRCLEEFELRVEARPQIQVSNLNERAQPEEGWELGAPDRSPTLAALIEDELLLSLPFAPRHPQADCPTERLPKPASEADTQRPFADLARSLAERNRHED